jgi:hypothetical protein
MPPFPSHTLPGSPDVFLEEGDKNGDEEEDEGE